MWAAKASYLTQTGAIYARITNQPIDAIIVRFFGFFFFAWQTAELWGNLISSLVLSNPLHGGSDKFDDSTLNITKVCGASFCDVEPDEVSKPNDREIFLISSIYFVCVLVAVGIIVFFVDPLTRYETHQRVAN